MHSANVNSFANKIRNRKYSIKNSILVSQKFEKFILIMKKKSVKLHSLIIINRNIFVFTKNFQILFYH